MVKTSCVGWCKPTEIYFWLSLFSILGNLLFSTKVDEQYGGQNKVLLIFFHAFGSLVWTFILYWLCSNCYNKTAWALLLLPFFMSIGLMVFVVKIMKFPPQ